MSTKRSGCSRNLVFPCRLRCWSRSRKSFARDIRVPSYLKVSGSVRGERKAGGIKFPKDLKDAENTAKDLLKLTIGGSKTKAVLVEPMMNIASELYLSVTLDRGRGCPIFIASAEGNRNRVLRKRHHDADRVPIQPLSRAQIGKDARTERRCFE